MDIGTRTVARFYSKVFGHRLLETGGFNRDGVMSDGKEGEGVVARAIGLDGALVVGSEVGEGNAGIRDTGARGVRYRAKNVSRGQLR